MNNNKILYIALAISILAIMIYVFGFIKSPNATELRNKREAVEETRKEIIREGIRQQKDEAIARTKAQKILEQQEKARTIQLTKEPALKPTGLTYGEVMQDLTDYFPNMAQSELLDGKTRYLGQSTGGSGLGGLEITGPKDSVLQAVLMVALVPDNLSVNAENMIICYIFLKNVGEELKSVSTWRSQLLDAALDSWDKPQQVIAGQKRIIMTFNAKLGSLIIEVKHKDS